jgi:hypothetical protein
MADVQTFEVDANLAPVNVGPWNFVFCYIFRGLTTFNKTTFAKNEKYEHGGWLKFKIFCSVAKTHEPLHLEKQSFVQWKIMDIPTSFILIIIFFNKPFEYSGDGIFKLLRWIQTLHQSTWGHNILYADRSSEGEQLLIWPLLRETKNTYMAGSWKLKLTF